MKKKKSLKQNDKYMQRSTFAYQVYIDWKSIENGGRKQNPMQGIHYFTTNIKYEDQNNAWSIVIKLDALRPNQALLWFLVDAQNQQLEVGHMIELLAGNRCVADAMVYSVKQVKDFSFWFESCSECHGQGRMQLFKQKKNLLLLVQPMKKYIKHKYHIIILVH